MTTNSRRQPAKVTIFLVVTSLVAAHLFVWLLPGVFAPLNAQLIDRFFRLRQAVDRLRPAYHDTIVHVDINNTAIQKLNNYYLNRSYYARAVRNLAAMGTAIQAYDFIFASRLNAQDDQALIAATREAGTVYFGLAFLLAHQEGTARKNSHNEEIDRYLERTKWPLHVVGDPSGLYVGKDPLSTFIPLASAAKGLGFINIKPDADGVFRRVPLLVRFGDGCYPSFALKVVCDYLGVAPERITVAPGNHITLRDGRRPGGASRDIVIPIDDSGNMLVNYIGPWERMTHYSFADVYNASENPDEMETWTEELKGKIALISDVSTGSSDVGPVPTDLSFPLSGLHANAIHTILSEEFLREASNVEMTLIELLLVAIVLALSLRFATPFFPIHMVTLAAGYLIFAGLCFLKARLVVGVIGPLMMMFFAGVLVTAYRYFIGAKEKEVLRRTLEAYFPPLVVKKIMTNPGLLTLGGQKKELTVLFSDIKDFTTHSAALSPAQIQHFLNEYFEAMVEVVFRFQGTVDKYIGDGLMVFFGDPELQPDHAVRCVRAAIEMQKQTAELRERWRQSDGFPLSIRIGINSGEVVVGNMGSSRRLAYTVLGSAVNLAQRLETNARVGGILISQRTYELVKDEIATRPIGALKVKGIEEPVSAHEVLIEGQPNV